MALTRFQFLIFMLFTAVAQSTATYVAMMSFCQTTTTSVLPLNFHLYKFRLTPSYLVATAVCVAPTRNLSNHLLVYSLRSLMWNCNLQRNSSPSNWGTLNISV
ncbi:hypothetical protein KIN20_033136 [Parelaphostrongylus tenuis]|uniref:Secreted protein n=1 Tax=Parelaphostrongylus tenuis TaxID=148309 RepID=A0AAD5WIM1_PARTN|nr:hypothetical protein KIN20_033136 [Parelaphostrongylus tenuis]